MEETNILGENPTPIRHMGDFLLRAPLRRAVCVKIGGQIFTPSCRRLIKYPRRPASHLCVRFSGLGRGCAGCCGWQSSSAVDAPKWELLVCLYVSSCLSVLLYHAVSRCILLVSCLYHCVSRSIWFVSHNVRIAVSPT